MYQHQLLNIANQLLERSKLGGVDWQVSEVEKTYVVTYTHSAFLISSDELTPCYYRISVINENAVEVDFLAFQDENDDSYTLVSTLYGLAKRQAMGVDKILDTLLQEIEQQSAIDDLPFVKGGGKTYHWGCRCPA